VDAAGRLRAPVLFIHGLDDRLFSHRHSAMLHAAVGGTGELWLVPDADHVGAYDRDPAEYTRRLLAFLAAALREASAEQPTAAAAVSLAAAPGAPPGAVEVLAVAPGEPPVAIEVLTAAPPEAPALGVSIEPPESSGAPRMTAGATADPSPPPPVQARPATDVA